VNAPKLLSVEDCQFTNAATIRTQIKLRRGIQGELVGDLYLSVLESEIEKLEALLRRAPMYEFEIRRPDDFHVHLRQGAMLEKMVSATAHYFARALVMPNTTPPILTGQQARDYAAQIRQIANYQLDSNCPGFEPLMTIKLVDSTTPETVIEANQMGVVAGKLYPVGMTTNAGDGVTKVPDLAPTFKAMQEVGMVLCLHAEQPKTPSLDRERVFLDNYLHYLAANFPKLKIVVEHVSTMVGVGMVGLCGPNVAATITVHHMLLTLDDVIGDKLCPHHFCKPIAKTEEDRDWLVNAATSGNPKFFLGTDSAPHAKDAKEAAECAAGCFTAPVALPLLAEIFESKGKLENLERFTSENGARFYGLPLNERKVRFVREGWEVPAEVGGVVPFRAGKKLGWSIAK